MYINVPADLYYKETIIINNIDIQKLRGLGKGEVSSSSLLIQLLHPHLDQVLVSTLCFVSTKLKKRAQRSGWPHKGRVMVRPWGRHSVLFQIHQERWSNTLLSKLILFALAAGNCGLPLQR